jgi:hypothetical protein
MKEVPLVNFATAYTRTNPWVFKGQGSVYRLDGEKTMQPYYLYCLKKTELQICHMQ